MTLPKSWAELWAEKHNRNVLTQAIIWGGVAEMTEMPVPIVQGDVLLVIDNQCDKNLIATLQQHVRTDLERAVAYIGCVDEDGEGEGEPEIITVTNAVGGTGIDIPGWVLLVDPGEAGGELSVSTARHPVTGQLYIHIVLGTDAEGNLDPTKNTAAAIVALINGEDGEGEEELGIGVATAEYSGDGSGYVTILEPEVFFNFNGGYNERWASVYDSDGNELELTIPTLEVLVFGPYSYWPRFLGGRIILTAGAPPTQDGITTVQVQEV